MRVPNMIPVRYQALVGSLIVMAAMLSLGGCQTFTAIVDEARWLAEDVRDYQIEEGKEDAAEKTDRVANVLAELHEKLVAGDEIEWSSWKSRLEAVWVVAKEVVPKDHRLPAHLIVRRIGRVLDRLEQQARKEED